MTREISKKSPTVALSARFVTQNRVSTPAGSIVMSAQMLDEGSPTVCGGNSGDGIEWGKKLRQAENPFLNQCSEKAIELTCNLCGSHNFAPSGPIDNICLGCGAWTRQRVVKFWLDHLDIVKPGARVMHIAPEKGMSRYLSERLGDGYEAYDINPNQYPYAKAKKLDLVTGVENLSSEYYDLILHSHVMEHIPCNITAVLYHLHRALKPTGYQVMAIPILGGHYSEHLGPLTKEEATKRFGQWDHCRHFSFTDLHKTLGMIFKLPLEYDAGTIVSRDQLERAGIPLELQRGLTGSTIFTFGKADLLLRGA
jgi:phosphoglycolate phosphatase